MAVTNNDGMYSYLDQLSTQELEDLLQKDMETADGGDPDMVMYILEVIEKREGGADKEAATTALKDFSPHMQRQKVRVFSYIPAVALTT